MEIEVNTKLHSTVKYDSTANVFVSYTPSLGIYSQGVTREAAKIALDDAIHSFLLVASKYKVLDEILQKLNFKETGDDRCLNA